MQNNNSGFRSQVSGFTLIELLVVIAIIAILMTLLIPTMGTVTRSAKKMKALTEIKAIETAVKAYMNEYSRFPHMVASADYDYGYDSGGDQANNSYLMNVLRSIADVGNQNGTNNPRKIIFLETSAASITTVNPVGCFVDPWGKQYKITVDTDFNNGCIPPAASAIENVTNRNVIVWSAGADLQVNTADDVKSWK